MQKYRQQLLIEFKRQKNKNWKITPIPRGIAIQIPDDESVQALLKIFPIFLISAVHPIGKPKIPIEIRVFNNSTVGKYQLNPPSVPDSVEMISEDKYKGIRGMLTEAY